jgi:hypothetical protein
LVSDDGANVTETVQFAPAASVVPQVVVCLKPPGLAPTMLMPLIVSAELPEFVRIADCEALVLPLAAVKVSENGARET